jgi:uncharacterized protein
MHRRTRPRRHKLAYDVTYFLLDLDELPMLDKSITGFAYNRSGLFSFYDRDHGAGTGEPLRPWVESHLAAAGIDINGGAIRLLCYPRTLGYVFNPISIYFCYRPDGALAAVLYEVTNTFHERHTYLMPVDAAASDENILRHACAKEMYVSPFIDMDMTYNFRIRPPGGEFALSIQETDAEGTLLFASFAGRREELSSKSSVMSFLKFPFLTLKVIGGIHWEALKLWLKGVPLVHHPRPPAEPVTIVKREKIAA